MSDPTTKSYIRSEFLIGTLSDANDTAFYRTITPAPNNPCAVTSCQIMFSLPLGPSDGVSRFILADQPKGTTATQSISFEVAGSAPGGSISLGTINLAANAPVYLYPTVAGQHASLSLAFGIDEQVTIPVLSSTGTLLTISDVIAAARQKLRDTSDSPHFTDTALMALVIQATNDGRKRRPDLYQSECWLPYEATVVGSAIPFTSENIQGLASRVAALALDQSDDPALLAQVAAANAAFEKAF